jgi:hypothetical protein
MTVVNHHCDSIYDHVYIQTYALIVINVGIFILIKYLLEEFLLPFVVSWYSGEDYSGYSIIQSNNDDMTNLEALVRPVDALQVGQSQQPKKNIFTLRRGNSKLAANTSVSSNIRIKYTGKLCFVAFQFLFALISFFTAAAYLDYSQSMWNRYQNFFGYLLNTGFLTCFISCSIYRIELNRKMSSEKSAEMNRLSRLSSILTGIVSCILIPPFLTHLIPGTLIYGWVIIAFIVAIFILFVVMICFLESFAGMLRLICRFETPPASDKMFQLGLELAWRLLAMIFFQTIFNYMYFFYQIHSDKMTGSDYVGVLRDEYTLRTQTLCMFHHATDSFKQILIFFNWL